MKIVGAGVGLWLLASLTLAAETALEDEVIPYSVTRDTASSQEWEAGADVYEKLGREGFDREPMVEIKPRNNPSNLPDPTVIPYSQPEPAVVDLKAAMAPPEKRAKGPKPVPAEDRVYYRIRDADRRGRCFLLAKDCEFLALPSEADSQN